MATGGGKTVVMAMLIAWQTLNKVQSPRDARFTNRFLVVTPGLTIRDRLRVLLPEDAENYYDLRDLIPADLKGGLEHARIVITNYHAFQLKDAKEIKGVAKNTRLLLKGDRKDDPFKETPQAMVSRVLRDLGPDKQQIMVLNDEAHHCYADRPLQGGEKADKEQQDANEEARVWFKGLQAIAKHVGHQADLRPLGDAVLPQGLRLQRGLHLPVDGQRLLADGRDRVGHRQGAAHAGRRRRRPTRSSPTCACGTTSATSCPSAPPRTRSRTGSRPRSSKARCAASTAATRRRSRTGRRSCSSTARRRRCSSSSAPNTVVCKLVYDWIAGEQVVEDDEVVAHKPGKLALLSTSSTASRSRGRAPSSSTRRSSSPARG